MLINRPTEKYKLGKQHIHNFDSNKFIFRLYIILEPRRACSISSRSRLLSTCVYILRGREIKEKSLDEKFLNNDHHGFKEDVKKICLIDKNNLSDPHKRILLDEVF